MKEHYRKLEKMYASAPINTIFKPVLRVGMGEAEIEMDVRQELHHAAHSLHGAVYFKALDDAAWFAVNSLVGDVCVMTATFTVEFLRPVRGGKLNARARVLHSSGRRFVAEAMLEDADGQLVGLGRGTFMRSRIPLDPSIGYA